MSDEIKKGLLGIVVDETEVSKVMPEINSLTYRGYAAQDLCAKCKFEEVAYLILNGELPTKKQLKVFEKQERKERKLSKTLIENINSSRLRDPEMPTAGLFYLGCLQPQKRIFGPASEHCGRPAARRGLVSSSYSISFSCSLVSSLHSTTCLAVIEVKNRLAIYYYSCSYI